MQRGRIGHEAPSCMKLYIYEHCPFCTRARMIFGLKSLPVELSVVLEGDARGPRGPVSYTHLTLPTKA